MFVSVNQSYYNIYGGGQFPFYGGTATGMMTGTSPFYPSFQFGQSGNTTTNYSTGQGNIHKCSTSLWLPRPLLSRALPSSTEGHCHLQQALKPKQVLLTSTVCIHLSTLFTIQTHLSFVILANCSICTNL
jgi:hypothetical protein